MRVRQGPLKAYRIANRQFADLDGVGAALYPQRWNRAGQPVVYAGLSLAVCQLELLVHLDRATPPKNHVWIEIDVPKDVTVEEIDRDELRGWSRKDCAASRRFGAKWLEEERSVGLIVPSKAAPNDRNLLLNPRHPRFQSLRWEIRGTMAWDVRFFEEKRNG